MLNPYELTGRTRSHIVQHENPRYALHKSALQAFQSMACAAAKEGVSLTPFSSFRDFQAQVKIWNNKFCGKRPLYDAKGKEIDSSQLDETQRIYCILRWSALPGASRHHWGTDLDLIDNNALPAGYRVRLLPEEFSKGGLFYPMSCWLQANMTHFGFFRPYAQYRGGISAEPWHLSFGEISHPALAAISVGLLTEVIQSTEIRGRAILLDQLENIYQSHVLNICS